MKRCEKGPCAAHLCQFDLREKTTQLKMKGDLCTATERSRKFFNVWTRAAVLFLHFFFLTKGTIQWAQPHFLFLFIRANCINK